MKIQKQHPPAPVERSRASAPAEAPSAPAGPAPAAQVSVSSRAQELSSGPSVDAAKVARLRSAMEAGQFEVDADRIAQAIVDEER